MNNQTIPTRKRIHLLITCFCLSSLLSQCSLKQDRTTGVYGTITDQNGEPVDSILVVVKGARGFTYERLAEVYSDKNGQYELITEVLGKYNSADVGIPFLPVENAKYDTHYKGKKSFKEDAFTNDCCQITIGDKTKYDFQLIPK